MNSISIKSKVMMNKVKVEFENSEFWSFVRRMS